MSVSILLILSVVFSVESATPCTPPSHVSVSCGESKLINETVTELSVADGYGVNLCLKEKLYETQTYSYSLQRYCRSRHHHSRSRHHHRCSRVCVRDSGECNGGAVNVTVEEIDCCNGFAIDPSLVSSCRSNKKSLAYVAMTSGCPIRLQESIIHSLLELGMIKFFLELSLADPDLTYALWPKEGCCNETFTVFTFSDEEYSRLEDLLLTSDVSRVIQGHIVNGTMYSYTLNQGDILTPIYGNFSLHVTTVMSSSTKARNGIVHVMDAFIPLSNKTIIEVLASQPDRFSNFSTLLEEAGVKQSLSLNDKSWTVLAPTNAALEKLPEGALRSLLQEENHSQLRLFVLVLISSSVEYRSTLSQRSHLPSLTRYSIVVTAENETISLTFGKITIDELDIPARNGVIHVLSEPIVPPSIDFASLCSRN